MCIQARAIDINSYLYTMSCKGNQHPNFLCCKWIITLEETSIHPADYCIKCTHTRPQDVLHTICLSLFINFVSLIITFLSTVMFNWKYAHHQLWWLGNKSAWLMTILMLKTLCNKTILILLWVSNRYGYTAVCIGDLVLSQYKKKKKMSECERNRVNGWVGEGEKVSVFFTFNYSKIIFNYKK